MADYYSIITQRGKELEAAALANGTKISLTHFAVGDSKGQELKPNPALTSLVNESWRGDIADLIVSPEQASQMMARLVLPPNVGGFTVREIGLLTDAGELYAVANCPAIDKPAGGVSVNLQFRLAVSDTSNITLNVATGDGLFLRQDANLYDVKDKVLSRKNLELGTAATQNVGVTPGSVMRVDDFAHSCFAAEMGIRRVLTGSNPPSAPGVWCVANSSWTPLPYGGLFYTTNSGDLSVGSADGRFNNYIFIGYGSVGEPIIYFATDVNGRFSGWSKAYTTNSKPSAADVGAWSKGESDGRFAFKSITINGQPLSSNVNLTAGDVNAWNKTESDGRFVYSSGDKIKWLDVTDGLAVGKNIVARGNLTINGQDWLTKSGNYTSQDGSTRQTNGLRINGSGDMLVDIFHFEQVGQYHSLGFHVAGGGGGGWFDFRNDGSFHSGGTVGAGNARLYADGNISGDKWGGYLSDWLWREFNARDNNIDNKFNQSITNIYQGSRSWVHYGQIARYWTCPGGHFVTGISQRELNGSCWIEDMEYAPLWKVTPTGQWII